MDRMVWELSKLVLPFIFIALILLINLVVKFFSEVEPIEKGNTRESVKTKKVKPLKLGILLGKIHLYFAGACFLFLLFGMSLGPFWLFFILFDFPTIQILALAGFLFHNPDIVSEIIGSNLPFPFLFFLTAGTLQYFLIGTFLGWAYNKFHRKTPPDITNKS